MADCREASPILNDKTSGQQTVFPEPVAHELHTCGETFRQTRGHQQPGQAQHSGAQERGLCRTDLGLAFRRALVVVDGEWLLPRVQHEQDGVALKQDRSVAGDRKPPRQGAELLVARLVPDLHEGSPGVAAAAVLGTKFKT